MVHPIAQPLWYFFHGIQSVKIQSTIHGLVHTIVTQLYANVVTKRLTKANHVTWKAQVMIVLHKAHLVGHITGSVKPSSKGIDGMENGKPVKLPNPAYEYWFVS
jgi:hypothetical protein